MKKISTMIAMATLVAAAGGCNNDDASPSLGTVSSVAASEIATATGDGTVPIEINDRPFSSSDTRDDTEPMPVT